MGSPVEHRQDFRALSDLWVSEPYTLHQSFRHGNCPQKCKFLWQWNWLSTEREKNSVGKRNWRYKKSRKEKGSSGFSSAPNTSKTYRACSHTSWLRNFQYSHLQLLSWAGNRLECSHSYTLLRYISVKKKQMLRKFWRLIVQGRGVGGLDFRVFLSNQFPCLELFPSDLLLLDTVDCFSPQFALPGWEELYWPCSPQAFLWYLL